MSQIKLEKKVFTRKTDSFISWKAVFSGLLISMLCFSVLSALGFAIGSLALSDLEGLKVLGWSATIWTIFSAMISLFVGCFYASRISNYLSGQVSLVQALSISALFLFLVTATGSRLISGVGSSLFQAGTAVSSSLADSSLWGSPQAQRFVENRLMTDFGIEADKAKSIASGALSRLIQEGPESAKNYILARTDLSQEELNRRWINVQSSLEEAAKDSAEALSAAGWFLFLMLLLSSASGVFGGFVGSRENCKHSLVDEEFKAAS